MHLVSAPLRRPVRVTGIRNLSPTTLRLMEMGLVEGAQVEVDGAAPLGDPIQIRVGDDRLSIRLEDARSFDVTLTA